VVGPRRGRILFQRSNVERFDCSALIIDKKTRIPPRKECFSLYRNPAPSRSTLPPTIVQASSYRRSRPIPE
jgi:hypothetical protein